MAKLQLSLMMSSNARSQPVLDGSISPDGIELTCTVGHPSEIFWRQLQFREFDLSEMSLSSLLIAIAGGNTDWVGLPIFPRRRCGRSGGWVRAELFDRFDAMVEAAGVAAEVRERAFADRHRYLERS